MAWLKLSQAFFFLLFILQFLEEAAFHSSVRPARLIRWQLSAFFFPARRPELLEETLRRGGGGGKKIRMLTFCLREYQLASNMCWGDVRQPRGGVPEMRAGSTLKKKKKKKDKKQRKTPPLPSTSLCCQSVCGDTFLAREESSVIRSFFFWRRR